MHCSTARSSINCNSLGPDPQNRLFFPPLSAWLYISGYFMKLLLVFDKHCDHTPRCPASTTQCVDNIIKKTSFPFSRAGVEATKKTRKEGNKQQLNTIFKCTC